MSARERPVRSRPTIAEQRAKVGRPTKLSPRVRAECVALLQTGAPRIVAAKMSGISYDSLNEYKKQGEADSLSLDELTYEQLTIAADAAVDGNLGPLATFPGVTEFTKFSVAIERAELYFVKFGFAALSTAGSKGDSRAIFGMLARLLGKDYQDPAVRVALGGTNGEPLDLAPKFVVGRLILPNNNRPVAPPKSRRK